MTRTKNVMNTIETQIRKGKNRTTFHLGKTIVKLSHQILSCYQTQQNHRVRAAKMKCHFVANVLAQFLN